MLQAAELLWLSPCAPVSFAQLCPAVPLRRKLSSPFLRLPSRPLQGLTPEGTCSDKGQASIGPAVLATGRLLGRDFCVQSPLGAPRARPALKRRRGPRVRRGPHLDAAPGPPAQPRGGGGNGHPQAPAPEAATPAKAAPRPQPPPLPLPHPGAFGRGSPGAA